MWERLKRMKWRTAIWQVALLLVPFFSFGQIPGIGPTYKVNSISAKWIAHETGEEIQLTGTTYGYEIRVAVGRDGDFREVGVFREKKGDFLDVFPLPQGGGYRVEYHSFSDPLTYREGDWVQLRWYDHMFTSANLGSGGIKKLRYPSKGVVTIKEAGSGMQIGEAVTFFEVQNNDAAEVEVRIPWNYNDAVQENAGAAIFTALNSVPNAKATNINKSFDLPVPKEGDAVDISLIIEMSLKQVKSLKFVENSAGKTFDGTARVRMKSPGDKGFFNRTVYKKFINMGRNSPWTLPYFHAYPYPNNDEITANINMVAEGWIMAVEARGVAQDGVCVDKRYNGRKVKIPNPIQTGTQLGATNAHYDKELAWDGYGLKSNQDYWFVPLWAQGETIEVMPGPCPGQMLNVQYAATGDGYSDLMLYKDEKFLEFVASSSEIESNRELYATLTRDGGGNDCETFKLLWNVDGDPEGGNACDRSGDGYSFKPDGKKGQVVKVWGAKAVKKTKLIYDATKYEIKKGGVDVASDTEVDCGAEVTVGRKKEAGDPGCIKDIEVWVNGTEKKGVITWDEVGKNWMALPVRVEGDGAKFSFAENLRKYKVQWSAGTGYTLEVKANGGKLDSPAEVDCGSTVVVTVTPSIARQRVLGIKAMRGSNKVGGAFDSDAQTLTLSNLSQSIDEIVVELGADPTGLTVNVDERFGGVRVAKIKVTNTTQSKVIWEEGKLVAAGGRFSEGDELVVEFVEVVDACRDGVTVKVSKRGVSGGVIQALETEGAKCTILRASEGIDVTVETAQTKQYTVSWASSASISNFQVMASATPLTSGGRVDCGSEIEIVPRIDGCQEVESVKVNGNPVDKSLVDGRYRYEVKGEVTSIEVTTKVKALEVTWGSLAVEVRVNGASTASASPEEVNCGAELRLTFTPRSEDGAVQAVTVAEEGGGDVQLRRGEPCPAGYNWTDGTAGAVTVTWVPRANVAIKSVELPKQCTVKFESKRDVYDVVVSKKDAPGAALVSPATVLSGTELGVTVTVVNPAQYKVVSINGSSEITVAPGSAGVYTYTFKVEEDIEVTVGLSGQKYRVNYSAASGDVKKKEVWKWGKGGAEGGEALPSGTEVGYGTEIYVNTEALSTAAVQGVEKVEARYKGGALVALTSDGEGWYKLQGVTGEIEEIVVTVLKLERGEVFVVYSNEAKGAEEHEPNGVAKGLVRWYCNGVLLEPGKNNKVRLNDFFRWELEANPQAGRTGLDELNPVCLAINRVYTLPFTDGSKRVDFGSLKEILPESLKEPVGNQQVTTLHLDTYVSMSLGSLQYLVLYVQDPRPMGNLEVKLDGSNVPLGYGKSFFVDGGKTVTVRALGTSPEVRLDKVMRNEEDLGLSLGQEKREVLPTYGANSKNGNRFFFKATFKRSEYDECLITLRVNNEAGGELTASRGRATIASGTRYQRGAKIDIKAQAKEGYYLQRVEFNGKAEFDNASQDTLERSYSRAGYELPARELTVTAYFEKSSKGKERPDGVDGAVWQGVVLYPNPTDGEVRVSGASVVARYSVFDVTGRELARGVHDGDAELAIDIRSLAAGYYLVRLYSAAGEAASLGVLRR